MPARSVQHRTSHRAWLPGLVAAVLLVTACTGQHTGVVAPLRGELVVEVKRDATVAPGTLFLKPLPGGLHGRTAGRQLFRSVIGQETVRLPVGQLALGTERHATQVRNDRSNPGELVSPRDLGIARIGVFYAPLAADTPCADTATRLEIDHRTRAMLVYVDRAGSVRGVRYARPWIMEYRLEFPAAGLYAVVQRTHGMHVSTTVIDATRLRARVSGLPCTDGVAASFTALP